VTDVSAEVLSLDLPCDTEAPALVRAALAEQGDLGWVVGDAMLVASELVTNAVLHSGSGSEHVLHVTAAVDGGCLRICVEDPGPSAGAVAPLPMSPLQISEFSDGGVGLLIVDQLVDRWGVERDGRYRVWAELALSAGLH
jgi:anti-sigma regulatory factor (Ser/Thr protein kinase)